MSTSNRLVLHGLDSDTVPSEVPPDTWTAATNMITRQGFMSRLAGIFDEQVADVDVNLFYVPFNYGAGSGIRLGAGKASVDVYSSVGGINIDVTGTWAAPSLTTGGITGGTVNNLPIINHVGQVPYYYPGAPAANVLPIPTGGNTWPATQRAAVLRCWKYHIFIGNVTQGAVIYPDMVMWSNAATPTSGLPTEWVATNTNDSRIITLADTPGAVVDFFPLRDQLVVFKHDSMYVLTYTGGNNVFNTRKVTESFGIASRHCAVDIGGRLAVLTSGGDVVVTDGQSMQSIATKRVLKQIAAIGTVLTGWLAFNELTSDLYVAPAASGTLPRQAFVYNTVTQLWGNTALTSETLNTAGISYASYVSRVGTASGAMQMAGLNQISTGLASQYVLIDSGTTFASGATIQGVLTREDYDGGEPDAVKTLSGVRLNGSTGTAGALVEIRVGARMLEGDTLTYGPWVTVDTTGYANLFATGRLLSFQLRSSIPGFQVQGFTVIWGVTSAY